MIEYDYCNSPQIFPEDRSLQEIYVAFKMLKDFVKKAPTSSKIHLTPRGVCFWINCLIGTVFVWSIFNVKNNNKHKYFNAKQRNKMQNNATHVQYRTTKFVEQQRTNQTKTCRKHVNQRNNLKPPGSEKQENKHPHNLVTLTPIQASKKIDILIRVQKCIKVGVVSYWGPGGPTKQWIIRQIVAEIWRPKKIKMWFPYKNEPLV